MLSSKNANSKEDDYIVNLALAKIKKNLQELEKINIELDKIETELHLNGGQKKKSRER